MIRSYLYQTLQITYQFWFLPLALHRKLKAIAGDSSLLNIGLWTLLRSERRHEVFQEKAYWRAVKQLALGNLLLMALTILLIVGASALIGLIELLNGPSAAVGVATGVAGGVAFGVAFGVASGVAYLRLHLSPLWMGWTCWQWFQVQSESDYTKNPFTRSAIQWDDLIYIRLPLFGRLLLRSMEADPANALNMLTTTAASTGQKWALVYAAPHWIAQQGQKLNVLSALGHFAEQTDSMSRAVELVHKRHAALGKLLGDFASVANSLAGVSEIESIATVQRVLDRNTRDLDSLKIEAGLIKYNELIPLAAHWQQLIRNYEERLEIKPRQVLVGTYQAGSALETGSPLFRGRREVFALTDEVYANPDRAETLLLIAQQRMGKSSALNQLPARLPDAHVTVIDCQRIIAGSGDQIFAVNLSNAIQRWERRRPGGIRNAPLTLGDVKKNPLYQLDRWLESYAKAVGQRRVMLCLDEFDKLVKHVHDGKLSEDVLGLLRSLSQAPEWMLMYSGQFELDQWIMPYAEHIKNVRRVRISYLNHTDATALLEQPVPNFALIWESDATEMAIHATGCQPYLLQMVGNQIVTQFQTSDDVKNKVVTVEHIEKALLAVLDSGRYYFTSLQNAFDNETNKALWEIATTDFTTAPASTLHRLVDQEYIQAGEDHRHSFRVPLLRDWWKTYTATDIFEH